GAPAILANLFAEETMYEFYNDYTRDKKGTGKIIKDFSWPHTPFPSHVTPTVPGSILEGGELGYSLSTAFGAVLDNPKLIAAAVVGDGEAETGPIAASWHSNKFLNPKTSGAVLPIIHLNGYKIANPTILGTMTDTEIMNYFKGLGYRPHIISGGNIEIKTAKSLQKAYSEIRKIQLQARKQKDPIYKPKWPVVVLRSPKGWKGIKEFNGHPIEGSFHSHGIPLPNPKNDPKEFKAIKKWLESYKIEELIDKNGKPLTTVSRYIPKGKYRMGMNKHAIGGNMLKEIKLPSMSPHSIKIKKRGAQKQSSLIKAGGYLKNVFAKNKKNFRIFCPDELESNKLLKIFEQTKRAYMWPIPKNAEHLAPEGRAMEILSEHVLQGWMQGYILTGRYGILVSYEAFTTIISSMVDQYAKFINQALKVPWRKPIPSAVYIESSVGWRQDHNGYSHQNPSFVSGVLQKHGHLCQIYYPADANAMLAALEETLKRKNSICVIVAGKRDLPQWQSLKEARTQAKKGIAIWQWVGGKDASSNPDVVLASAGDYITQEAIYAVKLCKELIPELKVRYVNVSELTALSLGDRSKRSKPGTSEKEINKYLTADKPVVFSYHGYTNDIEQILWPYVNSDRFSLHGYQEHGSTTTPFDMKVANGVSFYHLAIDLIEKAAQNNKKVARRKTGLIRKINRMIKSHQKHIEKHGDDPEEVKNMQW
ncbi:phosphoketolase, partial [Candidatus Peregrinibacteria bacterium]|nr:phosphoketolase [Candidatus Peregrinibacteria bacterium]